MKKTVLWSALAAATVGGNGWLNAAHHPESFGAYSTAIAESRLFVENDTRLRCDLLFTEENARVVTPKGALVSQSVPPFVWQFSGLLPVEDYLKTVAMHGYQTETQELPWQTVQALFYKGLRVEGAGDKEAKIAYAGAYAFAPRWPLIELAHVEEADSDGHSRLYEVAYTPVAAKGVSIDDYRGLARDILAESASVSLQDIRGVVDSADALKSGGMASEKKSLLDRMVDVLKPKRADKAGTGVPVEMPELVAMPEPTTEILALPEPGKAGEGVLVEIPEMEVAEVTINAISIEKEPLMMAAKPPAVEGVMVEIPKVMFPQPVDSGSSLWLAMGDGSWVLGDVSAAIQ